MTFNPSDNYDDDVICLKVEGEYQGRHAIGYCSSDAQGYSYYENGDVIAGPEKKKYNAPFDVDVVFHDTEISLGETRDVRREMGEDLKAQFDDKVEEVWEILSESENPLDDILDLEDGDLV